MITKLYLAANEVSISAYGHLQIVAQKDDGTFIETEVQSSGTNWVVSAPDKMSSHSDPGNTPGYGDPQRYKIIPLNLGDLNPDDVWNIILNQAAHEIDASGQPYNLTTNNSNAYVNTLLDLIGVDLNTLISAVAPPSVSGGFPTADVDVAGAPVTGLPPVAYNIVGSDHVDELHGGAGDDVFYGGKGDDRLFTGDGSNRIDGGEGDDTITSVIEVGAFKIDAYKSQFLVGGDGIDTIKGGTGDDLIVVGKLDNSNAQATSTWAKPEKVNGNGGNDYVIATTGNNGVVEITKGSAGSHLLLNLQSLDPTAQSTDLIALTGGLFAPVPEFYDVLNAA